MMDIRQIKIFIKVCEKMSFTQAARELNYAQSTISDTISGLEKDLNTQLFERIGKKIFLTHKGKVLLKLGLQLKKDYDSLIRNFSESHDQICIGITETLCSYKFPDFFRHFLEQVDHVKIHFKILRCDEIIDALKDNHIDLAYTLDEHIEYKEIVTHVLTKEDIVFISSNKEDTVHQKNLIIPEGEVGYLKVLWEYIRHNEIEVGTVTNIESIEGIKNYVKSGFGITFLPLSTVEKEVSSKELYILPKVERFTHEIKLLYMKDKYIFKTLEQLINHSLDLYM